MLACSLCQIKQLTSDIEEDGSNPSSSTVNINFALIAQSVEHTAVNRGVVGSSPTGGGHGSDTM